MTSPLRCHLLIGPPASGKSTLAAAMAPHLGSGPGSSATILSTDRIREELFGDAAVQGPWPAVESTLHERLCQCVADGVSVILDATHARRPWRLAILQALELPAPVEWVGWWLTTPLETCLEWNRSRSHSVPEHIVRGFAAELTKGANFLPERAEGFTSLVQLDPSLDGDLEAAFLDKLQGLKRKITNAGNRRQALEVHGYSRLLDLERLLHLLQLLSRYPGLEDGDTETRAELEALCDPLPEGTLAERAAAFLACSKGACYADPEALAQDLAWLDSQGFLSASPVASPVEPPATGVLQAAHLGGWSHLGDRMVFRRVMTLLRHILQHPFDREAGTPVHDHLLERLRGVGGVYQFTSHQPTNKKWRNILRKDIQILLTPYGFRPAGQTESRGYALGMALLSAPRLREVHSVVSQAARRLGDPTARTLLDELDERLSQGGVLTGDGVPVRAFANRSIVHPDRARKDCLAFPAEAERLEEAISRGHRIHLHRFDQAARFEGTGMAAELFSVWPLQLVFHNIGWYLAFEEERAGRIQGLISTERLDRLKLVRVEAAMTRSAEARRAGVKRLETLMADTGGIFFGKQLEAQLDLCSGDPVRIARQLDTVRFWCAGWVFKFLREGLQRYPKGRMRFPEEPPAFPSHPHLVEVTVPAWTWAADVDFQRWLFGFGAGVRVEAPAGLVDLHLQKARGVLEVYEAAAKLTEPVCT